MDDKLKRNWYGRCLICNEEFRGWSEEGLQYILGLHIRRKHPNDERAIRDVVEVKDGQ